MQLRNQVAERGDVELVAFVSLHQEVRQAAGLIQQLLSIRCCKLIYLTHISTIGHQDKPRVTAIVHEQQVAQGKASEPNAVRRQARVQFSHARRTMRAVAIVLSG
jgi:hypothetical protein